MLADARLVDALRLAVLVPLRLAVVLVLLAVVLLRLAVLAVCVAALSVCVVVVLAIRRVVLLRLAVVAICVAALLLLLSSFFIVKNVFVAFEFLNSLVDVCFTFSCASASSQRRVVLEKTTCHFIKNDGLFYQKRRVTFTKTTACFVVNEGKVCFRGNHLYGVCVFLPTM